MIQYIKLKYFVLLILAALAGLVIWPGCAEEPPPPAPKKTGYLYIGLVAPKSGLLAGLGESMIRGAELAVDAANKNTGEGVRPVKLKVEDEIKSRPNQNKLANDPRLMVFTGYLTEKALNESREVFVRANKPVILPVVTSARAPEQAPGIYYRLVASDDRQAASLAEFARDELKVKSVLIVHAGTDYGNRTTAAFQAALAANSSVTVEDISYPETKEDLSKLADRVAADPPGAVFLAMYTSKAVNVAQAFSAKKAKTIFLGTSVLGQNDTFPLLERLSEKFYLALPMNLLEPSDAAAALINQYEGKYHRAPNWISFVTYDAVGLAVAALREVGDEPGEVNRYLAGLAEGKKTWEGVAGTYHFGPQGQGNGPVYIVRAESSLLGRLP